MLNVTKHWSFKFLSVSYATKLRHTDISQFFYILQIKVKTDTYIHSAVQKESMPADKMICSHENCWMMSK